MKQLPRIVQQRLRATAKPGVHPDADLLTAFAEKSLRQGERAQVLEHLAGCFDCREAVMLAGTEAESAPAVSPLPGRSRWLTWPVLRWGALAACVLLVSVAVTLRHEAHRSAQLAAAKQNMPAAFEDRVALDGQAIASQGEKLTARIEPPAISDNKRDSGTAGKLAKPAQPPAQRKSAEKVERDQLARADAFKASTPGSRMSSSEVAAAAPGPPPAAKTEPKGGRDDIQASAPPASTEAVEVTAASNIVAAVAADEVAQNLPGKAKQAKDAWAKEIPAPTQGVAGGALAARNYSQQTEYQVVRTRNPMLSARWILTPEGTLQRSLDEGKTWQTVPVASNVVFRAVSASGFDVWVGGSAGALYHSVDNGEHWKQVKPIPDGSALGDIIGIEFPDLQHGKLTTAHHETWTTSDAGESWQKK